MRCRGSGRVHKGQGQFFFSIRKQHTVNKGTRVQGNGSEYFRGVVFSYSFSIYCAAYHGIWCSGYSYIYSESELKMEGHRTNFYSSHQNVLRVGQQYNIGVIHLYH